MNITKKLIPICLCLTSMLNAQDFTEWKDPNVNDINRLPMTVSYFAHHNPDYAVNNQIEKDANYLSLNGQWKFNFAQNVASRPTDFFKLGFDDSKWDDFKVPAVWELNGYGDPIYVNIGYPWKDDSIKGSKIEPPEVPLERNYVGSYRKTIDIPSNWQGKDVIVHFGAVTSNIYLWVNGEFVGYSEDSRLEAEFDITKHLKKGKNLIAFQVFRWNDGTWLEDQDMFRYSGVIRDVYCYSREKNRIEDINIEATLDDKYEVGSLEVAIKTKGDLNGYSIAYDLYELSKPDENSIVKPEKKVLSQVASAKESKIDFSLNNAKVWSNEDPNLYLLLMSFKDSKGKVLETISQKVGFRNIELKDGQILINGKPVLMKGVNRHDSNPSTGSYVTKENMLKDIKIIKGLNINALRTSHYPNHSYIYDLCDINGLLVVAEANVETHGRGYGANTLAKDKRFLKGHVERNERNVQRNRNHPSIIIWSLGNEAGMGDNFIQAYNKVKELDPVRPIQYGKAYHAEGSDLLTPMYMPYQNCVKHATSSKKPFILCEFAHAMGNSVGGLAEYMVLMKELPKFQGGFIWDFADQGVYHTTKEGVKVFAYAGDYNDYDSKFFQNFCNNGIVSPERKINPHAWEAKYQFQDIWTTKKDGSKVEIENEYYFIDLSKYKLNWEILADGEIVQKGEVKDLNVAPRSKATIDLGYKIASLPKDKELLLNVYYYLKDESLLLKKDALIAKQQIELGEYTNTYANNLKYPNNMDIKIEEKGVNILVSAKDFNASFDKNTGYLCGYTYKGKSLLEKESSLRPNFWRALTDNDMGYGTDKSWSVWRDMQPKLKSFNHKKDGNNILIAATYEMAEIDGILELKYVVESNGIINVTQNLKLLEARSGKAPKNYRCPMLRFGMRFEMPLEYGEIKYYGRGPVENYIDRHGYTFVGKYELDVKDSHYEYIRPQETGTRTGLRYWNLMNSSDKGIAIVSDEQFSASALLYTQESLDDSVAGKQNRHWQEVKQSEFINVNIDKIQMGVGGAINSWRYLPEEQAAYEVSCKDYSFNFKIVPLK